MAETGDKTITDDRAKPVWNKNVAGLVLIFVVYCILRLIAWSRVILLEGHDSVSYLQSIETFLTFNIGKVIDLPAVSSLFYAFWGAVFSLPGWGVETGARLVSMVFSILLFWVMYAIGRKIGSKTGVMLGLLLLALHPDLISHSFAIRTEPSYLATALLGLWLFWTQYKSPTTGKALLIGIVFGFAFMNRVEGIIYLLAIPVFQGVYFLFRKFENDLNVRRLAGWSLAFVVGFFIIAGPQIWRVSHKLDMFAINGRQVWTLILQQPDGKSYEEKIYGLDYDDGMVNIDYLMDNTDELNNMVAPNMSDFAKEYARTIYTNINDLSVRRTGDLFGPVVVILFGFGLLSLYRNGYTYEIVLILLFIGVSLAGPMIHDVDIRHILIIVSPILLIAGIGMRYIVGELLGSGPGRYRAPILYTVIFILVLVTWNLPLRSTFNPPHFNRHYDARELRQPIGVINRISENEHNERYVLASRMGYLAYYAGVDYLPVPHTDYDRFIRYLELNDADFVYLNYRLLRDFPFLQAFRDGSIDERFELLFRGTDTRGGDPVELYGFNSYINNIK
jgi:hypothetical protein